MGTCHASMACPLVCVMFSSCRSEGFDTLLLATLHATYVQDVSRVCATALSINRFGVRACSKQAKTSTHCRSRSTGAVPPIIQHTKRYILDVFCFVLHRWIFWNEVGKNSARPGVPLLEETQRFIRCCCSVPCINQSLCPRRPLLTFSMGALSHGTRFYNPGMPAETPTFSRTLCEESEGLADTWANAAKSGASKVADAKAAKFEAWTSPQQVRE